MSKLRKQTLDGNIETMLLALLEDSSSYGYQIVEDLNKRAQGMLELGEGTVYPVLHRIERRGLIRSYWQTGENGRKRKYYHLTATGKAALEENRRQWGDLVRIMKRVLTDPKSAEPAVA